MTMGIRVKKKDALDYHSKGKPGKLEIIPSKPCLTQRDLSIAYTPYVAEPCREIEANPDDVYKYTGKGNLVAVISNGTAVLGLGDIGPLAAKPVMEGKGVLFKRFADVDAIDIEVDSKDPDVVINTARAIGKSFGGINLEDIKAPECFYIEEKLKKMLDIPVFHDDQHGTAIIAGAGLVNALYLTKRKPGDAKLVVMGAGSAGMACAMHFLKLGIKKENITMVDSRGVIYKGRKDGMNPYKERFARDTSKRTLADAMDGADIFLGVSVANIVTEEMLKTMAPDPIIFAMANPDPEVTYEVAKKIRPDAIMATGRSDYPNQVNNVLGFPSIFRGALDVRASTINSEMEVAATMALAKLAREDVPDRVSEAYSGERFHFGPDYIIPKPFDYRVLLWEAPAVAKAAMDTGVARRPLADMDEYVSQLEERVHPISIITRKIQTTAASDTKRIIFPEGDEPKVVRAAARLVETRIARPVLVGRKDKIRAVFEAEEIDEKSITIIDPMYSSYMDKFINRYFKLRQRDGITKAAAKIHMRSPINFALMMVREGKADGIVQGLTTTYRDNLRPAMRILGKQSDKKVFGVYMVMLKRHIYFFADTTVMINPSAEDLAHVAIQTAKFVRAFKIEPVIAMLSFSNFGSTPHPNIRKVRDAVNLVHEQEPDLLIDGEMQANVALDVEFRKENYPFSLLKDKKPNVFVFPNLESGNIAYKILDKMAGAVTIGPILLGMNLPVNILQAGTDVESIVNLTAFTVLKAQKGEFDL